MSVPKALITGVIRSASRAAFSASGRWEWPMESCKLVQAASARNPSTAERACSSMRLTSGWTISRSAALSGSLAPVRARPTRRSTSPSSAGSTQSSSPSYSPTRWLNPPPQRTAYLSSSRRPGTVLRVS